MSGYGVGEAVGGVVQARAQNKATAAQERMGNQAISEQRRQQTQERDRLRQMWDLWQGNRGQLMARYGLDVPEYQRSDNPFDDAHDRYMQDAYARDRALDPASVVREGEFRGGSIGDLAVRRPRPRGEWEV